MASVYILYSGSIDRYYVGFTTESVEQRLQKHNDKYYDDKWTSKGRPWELFLEIRCNTDDEARKVEKHIKKMKSKTYLLNLRKYPEMVDRLRQKAQDC